MIVYSYLFIRKMRSSPKPGSDLVSEVEMVVVLGFPNIYHMKGVCVDTFTTCVCVCVCVCVSERETALDFTW